VLPIVDSLEYRLLEGAALAGYGAPLASAVRVPVRPEMRTIRSTVMIAGGSNALDDNALEVTRSDSINWLEITSLSGERGQTGSLGRAGRHQWSAGIGRAFGAHHLSAAFTHRGVASGLLFGAEQSAKNESGFAGWEWRGSSTRAGLSYERGYGHHYSFGDFLLESRRAADATRFEGSLEWSGRLGRLQTRGDWTKARVNRTGDGEFSTESNWGWGAASFDRPIGPGQLELSAGAGRHSGVGDVNVAPGAGYRFGNGRWSGHVGYERMLQPIWSDLAAGEEAFIQTTDAAVIEAAHHRGGLDLRLAAVGGRTEDRALVSRQPFEELWLREGIVRELDPYRFTLVMGEGRLGWRPFTVAGSAFMLNRTRSEQQPNVDPAGGGKLDVRWNTRFFKGDLGSTFTAGLDVVGRRESEFGTPLPTIVTSRAAVTFTLLDAFVIFDVRNLENQPYEEVWIDPLTGIEALSSGVEWRLLFNVRLRN